MSHFVVLTAPNCKWCDKVKGLIEASGHSYEEFSTTDPTMRNFFRAIGLTTVPQVWDQASSVRVGGYEATVKYLELPVMILGDA